MARNREFTLCRSVGRGQEENLSPGHTVFFRPSFNPEIWRNPRRTTESSRSGKRGICTILFAACFCSREREREKEKRHTCRPHPHFECQHAVSCAAYREDAWKGGRRGNERSVWGARRISQTHFTRRRSSHASLAERGRGEERRGEERSGRRKEGDHLDSMERGE